MFVIHDHHTMTIIRDTGGQRVSINWLTSLHLGRQINEINIITLFFEYLSRLYNMSRNDKRTIPNSAKGIIILKGINTGYTPTQDKTGKDD